MRYAIINIEKAESMGISPDNHLKKDNMMIVNEKEVQYSDAIGDTFEEKVATLDGEIKSIMTIKIEIKNGWKL